MSGTNDTKLPGKSREKPALPESAGNAPDRHSRDALDLILRQALFFGVPAGTLDPLVQRCEIRRLDAGDILLTPGQSNQDLFLLLDGRLKVHIERVDSGRGFLIAAGECAGEISIIDGRPATAFVVAEETCRVLVIPDRILWSDFLGIPQVTKNFMRLFAERFRDRNEAMQRALEQQLRYEHLQKELNIAHDIQVGMLPLNPDLGPRVDIAAEMVPAQRIGGDFYDVFPVNREEDCIAIGDVSGKGVPAALFMVKTMTLLRTEMLKDQPINEAVRNLNVRLCEDNPTCMFATLLVGILNKVTGQFRYINAGHDPIIVGTRGVRFEQRAPPKGILVGVDPAATYEVGSQTLAKGDVLLFYTDGITEAMNPDQEMFGVNRLIACLDQKPATTAQELADRVRHAVQAFVRDAPASDDLTMVVVRYREN